MAREFHYWQDGAGRKVRRPAAPASKTRHVTGALFEKYRMVSGRFNRLPTGNIGGHTFIKMNRQAE